MESVEAVRERVGPYAKDLDEERFLGELNDYLEPRERELYEDVPVEHPFVFVIGAPRSGTTLLSQLLAYCLDVGYVTNVAARFWRAPVHGLRLSRIIAGEPREVPFASDYARTPSPLGIHEFGYFWSGWLHKKSFADIVEAKAREDEIDWDGLRLTLTNMQAEFGRAFVAKNILGSHHAVRLQEILGKVLFVLIERDPLDAAVSILDARVRYYGDPNRWWSYVPPDYPRLENLDWPAQIAGQVHYLGRFYDRVLAEVGEKSALRVRYADLCASPAGVLAGVVEQLAAAYGSRPALRGQPPESFSFRAYTHRDGDKETFARAFEELRRDG